MIEYFFYILYILRERFSKGLMARVITTEDMCKMMQIHLIRSHKALPRQIMELIYLNYVKARYNLYKEKRGEYGTIYFIYDIDNFRVGYIVVREYSYDIVLTKEGENCNY